MKANLRQQLENLIIEKAMKEETFRKQLIEDPKGTVEEFTNFKFPEELKLTILEEDAQTFYLVIPQPAGKDELELTELDLADVSAGGGKYTADTSLPSEKKSKP